MELLSLLVVLPFVLGQVQPIDLTPRRDQGPGPIAGLLRGATNFFQTQNELERQRLQDAYRRALTQRMQNNMESQRGKREAQARLLQSLERPPQTLEIAPTPSVQIPEELGGGQVEAGPGREVQFGGGFQTEQAEQLDQALEQGGMSPRELGAVPTVLDRERNAQKAVRQQRQQQQARRIIGRVRSGQTEGVDIGRFQQAMEIVGLPTDRQNELLEAYFGTTLEQAERERDFAQAQVERETAELALPFLRNGFNLQATAQELMAGQNVSPGKMAAIQELGQNATLRRLMQDDIDANEALRDQAQSLRDELDLEQLPPGVVQDYIASGGQITSEIESQLSEDQLAQFESALEARGTQVRASAQATTAAIGAKILQNSPAAKIQVDLAEQLLSADDPKTEEAARLLTDARTRLAEKLPEGVPNPIPEVGTEVEEPMQFLGFDVPFTGEQQAQRTRLTTGQNAAISNAILELNLQNEDNPLDALANEIPALISEAQTEDEKAALRTLLRRVNAIRE